MNIKIMMWITMFISMVLHEVGHAEIAKRKGLYFAFYQLGIGPSLYDGEKLKIKLFPVVFAAAIGVDHDKNEKDYIEGIIWTYMGGILVHLALMMIGFAFLETDIGVCLFTVNLLGILVNGVPYKCFGNPTDGYKIVQELKKLNTLQKVPA